VSDPQNSPQPSDPERSAPVGDDVERVDPVESIEGDEPARRVERIELDEPVETDVTDDVVTVRRAPRYGRFITLGALVGAVVALILTFAFSGQPADAELALGFDKGQVFGFLLLLCATIGAAIGADRGAPHRPGVGSPCEVGARGARVDPPRRRVTAPVARGSGRLSTAPARGRRLS